NRRRSDGASCHPRRSRQSGSRPRLSQRAGNGDAGDRCDSGGVVSLRESFESRVSGFELGRDKRPELRWCGGGAPLPPFRGGIEVGGAGRQTRKWPFLSPLFFSPPTAG